MRTATMPRRLFERPNHREPGTGTDADLALDRLHTFINRLAAEQYIAVTMLAKAHAAALAGTSFKRSLAQRKAWLRRKAQPQPKGTP
jgi:hypothetical protein